VDGVFVTHAHFDHIQDVCFLDPCIPVYCTEKTKILDKAMTDVSPSGVDDQYFKLAKEVTIKQKHQHTKPSAQVNVNLRRQRRTSTK
jgi:phosphoribosyl 1,2-cyclic phosphodiesterase